MDIVLIALLASVSAGVAVFAMVRLHEDRQQRQLMQNRALGVFSTGHPRVSQKTGLMGWLRGFGSRAVSRFGDAIKPKNPEELGKSRMILIHAGFRQPNALEMYWGIKAGAALAGLIVGLLIAMSGRLPGQYKLLAMLGSVAVMFYMPGMVLNSRVKRRQKAIQHALPDALDLLVVCVEAGMGLDAAMYRVCVELSPREPVLGSELRLLTLELRAGKSRREALKNLATRVGLEDMGSLVAMLIQADMFGTSIAQTLRVYADAMRTKRFQLAEEMAAKLPVKLLFPLVFFIFPTLLIVILGPAGIRLVAMFHGMGQ